MYKHIKQLADEAIALQNKNRMDEVLREISACCERAIHAQLVRNEISLSEGPTSGFGLSHLVTKIAAAKPGDVVLPDGDETKAAPPAGFGLAHPKMEGCAIHPDDIDATMTDGQRARQLAAHERDVAAGGPAKTAKVKKGAK